ncbi:5-methylcytosine-specific restriction system specificity protein McrC [Gordonia alkaliphila]|uniref:5-methylcytosine restriction system specificity protein McrC n=1 Tax=Gordonia alkaliphila TaxID=1053547 RepID=UPI001FF6D4C5|nr:5-methylcytosine-specific restriction system specificity protein McrC [Gordonia alkaliphila]MCK0439540.1 5-methylcytosine-specific restriction system specificity protein McrC [Gordonia alkaliphila]
MMTESPAVVGEPGVILSGTKTKIPVRNVWLLMVYASELFQHDHALQSAGTEDNPDDLVHVVAEILVSAVERRLRRNLGRDYRARDAVLTRVRGRIDVLATESGMLLAQGRVACRFDELTVDNPRNRLLLTALDQVARGFAKTATSHRHDELRRRARALATQLTQYGVSPRPIDRRAAADIVLGRNEVDDRDAVDAAKLLLDMMILTEEADRRVSRTPLRDVDKFRALYEKAVRGFYRAVLRPEWSVKAGNTWRYWPLDARSSGLPTVLPIMNTDIELERGSRRIIIETKFAEALKSSRSYDGDQGKPLLASKHLYQLYAYVQSQHDADTLGPTAEGVLLYPTVAHHLEEWAVMQGHRYRFLSVDLAGTTSSIRERLLDVTL